MAIRKNKLTNLLLIIAIIILLMCNGLINGLQAREPFSKDYWEKMRSKTDYTEKPVEKRDFEINILPGGTFELSRLMQIILISAVVILLIFIILRLLLKHAGQIGKVKPANLEIYDADDEFSPNDLLYSRFAEARDDRNYRLALRYLYLMLLQHLSSLNLIELRKGKTNLHYCIELDRNNNDYNLKEITKAFEAAWFGDQNPDEESFHRIIEPYTWLTINTENGSNN